ncbi:MAG TPA: Holliday junction branch migration protein RuvA [Erysipelotrichaceae bacterium]|nr:Holliday junction branch migration protein RuvA [Erysipelotrichaceae bacterium]
MIYFLRGKITTIDGDTIVVDVRDVGYQVLVSHVDDYSLNQEVFLYTYTVVREDDQYLVGFSSLEEKKVFLSLIKVKGLGPKTVINALSATTVEGIKNAIAANNIAYLKKLPGIGVKAAGQIILDLKGELTGIKGDPSVYEEVYDALKVLGFKGAAIDRVLATINEKNASAEDVLKIALKKLRK